MKWLFDSRKRYGIRILNYLERTKEQLGVIARSRSVIAKEGAYELREPETPYNAHSKGKNSTLSSENTYYWDVFPLNCKE